MGVKRAMSSNYHLLIRCQGQRVTLGTLAVLIVVRDQEGLESLIQRLERCSWSSQRQRVQTYEWKKEKLKSLLRTEANGRKRTEPRSGGAGCERW